MLTKTGNKIQLILAGLMGVVTLVVLGLAFLSVGSPGTNRLRSIDQRRLENLSGIANCVEGRWIERGEFLKTLDEIIKSENCSYIPLSAFNDPQTGAPYEYKQVDADTYALCATFALEDSEGASQYFGDRRWQHDAGDTCFERDLPPRREGELTLPMAKPVPMR